MGNVKDFVIKDGVLEKYIGKGGAVVIPDGVTCIGDGAFYNRESVTSIEIPDTVTEIVEWAFFRCKGLKTITIPDSVTSIGEKAFSQCTNLVWVSLSRSITSIENGTFEDCKNLMSVKIPDGVTRIGYHAFSRCSKLNTLIIPDSVTAIYSSAFSECNGLADEKGFVIVKGVLCGYYGSESNISLPEGITGIDKLVLSYHKKISALSFPESIRYIGEKAFEHTTIDKLVLPSGISEFEGSALEVILNYFFETEHKYLVIETFLNQLSPSILKNDSIKRKIKANKNKIVDKAIKNDDAETVGKLFELYEVVKLDDLNNYIEKANSATSVKAFLMNYKNNKYTYEMQAEHENDKLDKELGLKKRTITEWRKLYNFEVLNGQATITGYKGSDTHVVIPDYIGKYKVVAIGDFAFSPEAVRLKKENKETRKNLQRVHIPDTVTMLGKGAFYRCEALADKDGFVIVGGVLYSFHGMSNAIKLPDNVTTIDENAFCKGKRIVKIKIPDSVTGIGKGVFSKCKRLTIYASVGSYAEKYAKENNIPFVTV